MKIAISYNSEQEMIAIISDVEGSTGFYGSYSDISREPLDLAEFFRKLGCKVEIVEDLPPV